MKNSTFKLRNCLFLLCALIFQEKIKFFIKFTFLNICNFLLKKWGARLVQGRRVFEKIRYLLTQLLLFIV
jgi:hypothetical protein